MGTPAQGTSRRERQEVGDDQEVQSRGMGGGEATMGPAENPAETEEGGLEERKREAVGNYDD